MKYRKTNKAKRISHGCKNNMSCDVCRGCREHSHAVVLQEDVKDILAEVGVKPVVMK